MNYLGILNEHFQQVFKEDEFVLRLTKALEKRGFKANNTILVTGVCRDEIAQPLMEKLGKLWGSIFNISSLGALFIAGKTALRAAMSHSPIVDDKERYVFTIFPHIAIDENGNFGLCKRSGREEKSLACGALLSFLNELKEKRVSLSFDPLDIEQNYLKFRILEELSYGHIPDLLELTEMVRAISHRDLEEALSSCIISKKSDYALLSGIQIHGPQQNYIALAEGYVIIEGKKYNLTLDIHEEGS